MTTRVTRRNGSMITVEATIDVGGPILNDLSTGTRGADSAQRHAALCKDGGAQAGAKRGGRCAARPGRELRPASLETAGAGLGAYASAVVQAKEETWTCATPQVDAEITVAEIGTDGSCMLMCEGQWREAMTGSISLYDRRGERQHSIYVGAAPEHGRAGFGSGAGCWRTACGTSPTMRIRCITSATRTGGDRFGGDGGRMQDPGQAAPVPLGDALERRRCANDPEFARLAADANALGSVLAQAGTIWRSCHRQLVNG